MKGPIMGPRGSGRTYDAIKRCLGIAASGRKIVYLTGTHREAERCLLECEKIEPGAALNRERTTCYVGGGEVVFRSVSSLPDRSLAGTTRTVSWDHATFDMARDRDFDLWDEWSRIQSRFDTP